MHATVRLATTAETRYIHTSVSRPTRRIRPTNMSLQLRNYCRKRQQNCAHAEWNNMEQNISDKKHISPFNTCRVTTCSYTLVGSPVCNSLSFTHTAGFLFACYSIPVGKSKSLLTHTFHFYFTRRPNLELEDSQHSSQLPPRAD